MLGILRFGMAAGAAFHFSGIRLVLIHIPVKASV
jgi:hypothetical protein